jgi:hypothetical protein
MKSIALAIAAAATLALLTAPFQAFAADKPEDYTRDQISQGKKEAPAVAQAVGIPCTVTDAAFIGQSTGKDDAGKTYKQSIYEVACSEGLGYALLSPVGQPPKAFDCVALIGNPSLACRLPENKDPKKGLAPLVAQSGRTCTLSDARYLGSKLTGETFYEVGCGSAPGFLLETAKGQPPKIIGCDEVSGSLACKFTTEAQISAESSAAATALLAKSGKTCQLSKSRKIGTLQSGDVAYEVACADGSGYILEESTAGAFHTAINCANAGDSCKLTDTTKAQTVEAGTYTRLAKASGYPCDVAQYRFIGIDSTQSEVVELKCSNRPDGAVAVFPADNSKGRVLDCVQAGAIQQSCKLTTDQTPLYAKYTKLLASKGKTTCKVSNARGVPGQTKDGDNFIETACSDGLPGYVMVMTPAGSLSDLLNCGQAKAAGVACALPGNTK